MANSKEIFFFFETCWYLILIVSSFGQEECDKTKCPGPLQYYEGLLCKPIYKNPGDCCAEKYDCSHLKNKSPNKCYVNANVYEIGEKLKDEDANPCDIGCTCVKSCHGIANFNCEIVDCFHNSVLPNCYRKNSPLECCPGMEVCPENPEDRASCVVGEKIYKDGDYFVAPEEPEKSCVCQAGYEGVNIEPFCTIPKRSYCQPEFRHAYEVRNNCAPVYYSNQSPQTDCNIFSRCQNQNDTLISDSDEDKSTNDDSVTCIFGNIKMRIGDELNQATDYSSVCVKCICEVPPVPTCQRLPDEECDVTVHSKFDHFN